MGDLRYAWLLSIAFACATEPNYEGRLCSETAPCPGGFHCWLGYDDRCHRDELPVDAGPRDAIVLDAKPSDADPIDAGPIDADPVDADPIDADPADADPIDAEPIDGDLPDTGEHAVQVRVAGSSDDAMQDPPGPVLVSWGWVSLYSLDHWGATRFTVPSIPQGAPIEAAYIDVFIDSDMEDVPNIIIYVEPNASPAPLAAVNYDISSRALSADSVLWMGPDTGAGWHRTPDLRALVQEVVDLPAWTPDSSILFIWDTQSADDIEFRQWDYDAAGAFAAQLTIRYRIQ